MIFLSSLCDNADIKNIFMVIVNIIRLFCFIAPILAVLYISFDFGKAVVSDDEEAKKSVGIVIKRLIYCVCVFLVPFIVSFVIHMLNDSGIKISSCFTYDKVDKVQESIQNK